MKGFLKIWENNVIAMDQVFNRTMGRCVDSVSGAWECSEGNEHYEGHPLCTAGTSWTYTYTIHYAPCPISPEPDDVGIYVSPAPDGNTGGNGGGGSSNNTSTIPITPCSEVNGQQTTGFVGNSGSCYDTAAVSLSNSLNGILGARDSYIFDNTLNPNNVLVFESVEDLESFLNSINEFDLSNIDLIHQTSSTQTHSFNFNIDSLLGTNLKVNVEEKLPLPNSSDCLEILNVNSHLYGNTSVTSWDQNNNPPFTQTISPQFDLIEELIQGSLKIGLKINNVPILFQVTRIYTIKIDFNYSNGEPEGAWVISVE